MQNNNSSNNVPSQQTMGQPQGQPSQPSRGSKKNVWVLVIILIVLLLIVWGIYAMMNKSEQNEEINNVVVNKEKVDDGFPKEFFSYSGSVVSITDSAIVLNAPASKNYLQQDTRITAKFDDQTVFSKIIIPQTTSGFKPGQSGKLFLREDLTADEVKIGDQVTVIAFENVKGKTEFLAKKIEVKK